MIEEYLQKLHWRVLAGILVAIAVILVLLLITALSASPKRSSLDSAIPTPVVEKKSPEASSFQNPKKSSYTGSFYTVVVPNGWMIEESIINSVGRSATLMPRLTLSQKPSVEIQEYDANLVLVKSLEQIFTGFGFTKQTEIIDGNTVASYKGVIGTGQNALHETASFFNTVVGNKIKTVKIQTDYTGNVQDSELEGTLNGILSTIHILH